MKMALVAGLLTAVSLFGAKVGTQAPAFTVTDSFGKVHNLNDYKGKTVVLEWTNHECPYVVKHYKSGNMQQQQKELTDDGVVWLSVISSAPGEQGYVSADKANALTQSREAYPTAVVLDPSGDLGHLYDAKTTPHMYIIDPEGQLVYNGGIDSIASSSRSDVPRATQYVLNAYSDMKKGKKIANPVTRPYGCSVKYAF